MVNDIPAGRNTTGHSNPFAVWQVEMVTFCDRVRIHLASLVGLLTLLLAWPSCVCTSVESIDACKNSLSGVSLCLYVSSAHFRGENSYGSDGASSVPATSTIPSSSKAAWSKSSRWSSHSWSPSCFIRTWLQDPLASDSLAKVISSWTLSQRLSASGCVFLRCAW